MPYKDRDKKKAYDREWSRARPGRSQEFKQAARARNKAYLDKIKAVPCVDCGNSYPPYVMEFDHIYGEKVNHLSRMANSGTTIEKLQQEVDKCDIVCANCHRERTFSRAYGKTYSI